jgi:hypothetical protein
LAAALHSYDAAADMGSAAAANSTAAAKNGSGQDAGPGEFERFIKKSAAGHDLSWFFADWVDADKGLPDLSIAKVFTEPAQAGNTLVGVTVANAGYAAADVPITVSTTGTAITQRVLVPARGQVVQHMTAPCPR